MACHKSWSIMLWIKYIEDIPPYHCLQHNLLSDRLSSSHLLLIFSCGHMFSNASHLICPKDDIFFLIVAHNILLSVATSSMPLQTFILLILSCHLKTTVSFTIMQSQGYYSYEIKVFEIFSCFKFFKMK